MSNDPGAADLEESGAPNYSFWVGALLVRGSVTPLVIYDVLTFGAIAAVTVIAIQAIESLTGVSLNIGVGPFQAAGAVLGLLLVVRTNAGYDRWWEARKLWGGIVNQSRNLAIIALAYGPSETSWRVRFIRWTASFPHIARRSLRGERVLPEIVRLLGEDEAEQIAAAQHMPNYAAQELSKLLRVARDSGMNEFAFQEAERQRTMLIDYIGGCERILKTPLARSTAIQVRRFILLFLITLPFSLLDSLKASWGSVHLLGIDFHVNCILVPLFIMLLSYPLLSLDRIGMELQNPFDRSRVDHLPLDRICMTIEKNVMELLKQSALPEDPPLVTRSIEFPADAAMTQTFNPLDKDVS